MGVCLCIDSKGARSAPGLETLYINTYQQIQSVLYFLRIFTDCFTEVYEEVSTRHLARYHLLYTNIYIWLVAVSAKNRPMVGQPTQQKVLLLVKLEKCTFRLLKPDLKSVAECTT